MQANKKTLSVETPAPSADKAHPDKPKTASTLPTAAKPDVPLIPCDRKPTDEELIRSGAYFRWEAAGCPSGDGVNFWLDSERDFLGANVR